MSFGLQQVVSDMETDLPTVETQFCKDDLSRKTQNKASFLDMNKMSPKSLRTINCKTSDKENHIELAGDTIQSRLELESHETSKHYLISDL